MCILLINDGCVYSLLCADEENKFFGGVFECIHTVMKQCVFCIVGSVIVEIVV